MNSRELARFDTFKRVSVFAVNNANDFKPTPPATDTEEQDLFEALGTVADGEDGTAESSVIGNLIRAARDQQSGAGDYHGGTTAKSVQRDGLLAELRKFNRSAAAIATAQEKPEIMGSFRIPHGTNDQVMVARAGAFADAAEELKTEFLKLRHPANFITALRKRAADFEAAAGEQQGGLQDRAGATATIDDLIDQGLKILKRLDAIMHNLYEGNPQKLAAWLTASNIERPTVKAAQPATGSASKAGETATGARNVPSGLAAVNG